MKYFLRALILISLSPIALAIPFSICYESPHFFPYNENGSKDQALSPVIQAINVASTKAELETKYIRTSWARCLKDLKTNKVDAVLPSLWTEEREKFAVFPKDKNGRPNRKLYLLKANYKIYTHINSKVTWDGTKISNTEAGIGAPDGYVAKQKLKEMHVLKETNLEVKQAFDLIVKKRLDGYVALENVGDIILKDYPDKNLIKVLDKNFIKDNLYVPVSFEFAKIHPLKTKVFFEQLAVAREKYITGKL